MKKIIVLFSIMAMCASSSFAFTHSTGIVYTADLPQPISVQFTANSPGVYVELSSDPSSLLPKYQIDMYITCTLNTENPIAPQSLSAGRNFSSIYPWSVEQYVAVALPNHLYGATITYNDIFDTPQWYRLSW